VNYCADLHIHSPYSRATSPQSSLTGLAGWARLKGIQVIATGDFTHPVWFSHLQQELEPAEPGLFKLVDSAVISSPLCGITNGNTPVRFLLSAEISCIYKRHGKTRKVHNLLYVPDMESAARITKRLATIGNVVSDGRPILGLDSHDLLEMVLELSPDGFLVPAHIWTPWFSLFGSKSGFDTVEECFGDLSQHIFALETGLSSDPAMNRRISQLDSYALISNSDCHSPSNLGREVNLFNTGLDYFSLRDAIRSNDCATFRGTVEFFPEEGKYHADGHRGCQVCMDPLASRLCNHICPVCGKQLTIGVQQRVLELADRVSPLFPVNAPAVFSLIPLPELIGELLSVGVTSKRVKGAYARLLTRFESEFGILLETSLDEISSASPLLAEAVRRVRNGDVIRQPGYDGEYGIIRVFHEGEQQQLGLDPGLLLGA